MYSNLFLLFTFVGLSLLSSFIVDSYRRQEFCFHFPCQKQHNILVQKSSWSPSVMKTVTQKRKQAAVSSFLKSLPCGSGSIKRRNIVELKRPMVPDEEVFNNHGDESNIESFSSTATVTSTSNFNLNEDETFRNLYSSSLPSWLLDRLETLQFTIPTSVQAQSLPLLLEGKDVLIQSQTGSGKTLAYLLPLLAKIDPKKSHTQAIIVVPTRELGMQVASVAKQLASGYYYEENDDREEVKDSNNSNSDNNKQNNNDNEDESSTIDSFTTKRKKKRILIMSLLEGSANRRQKLWAKAEPPHIIIGNPSSLGSLMGSTALFGTEENRRGKGSSTRRQKENGDISNREEQKQRYRHVRTLVIDEVDAIQGNSKMRSSIHDVVTNALTTQIVTKKEIVTTTATRHMEECERRSKDDSNDATAVGDDDDKYKSEVAVTENKEQQNMKYKTIRYKPRQTILCSATIPQHHHFLKHCYQSQWTLDKPIHVHINNNLDQPRLPSTLDHLLLVCPEPKDRTKALLSYMKQIVESTLAATHAKSVQAMDENLSSIIVFSKNELEARIITTELQEWKMKQINSKSKERKGRDIGDYSIEIGMLLEGQNINSRRVEIDTFKQIALDQNVQTPTKINIKDKRGQNEIEIPINPDNESDYKRTDKYIFNILITTDFACRGLDLPSCSHVIQIGLPDTTSSSSSYSSSITQNNTIEYSASNSKRGNSQSKESYMDIYIHRAGRTGRMGQFGIAEGKVVTIVTAGEQPFVKRLCNALDIKMKTRLMQKRK